MSHKERRNGSRVVATENFCAGDFAVWIGAPEQKIGREHLPSDSEFELSIATEIDKAIRITLGASMRYILP